jgi:membrane-associated PAP2 superfamily phosphatase
VAIDRDLTPRRAKQRWLRLWAELGLVLALLVLGTWVLRATSIELTLAGAFYDEGWIHEKHGLWLALYRFGTLPALVLALASSWVWLWPPSNLSQAWVRRSALLIVLTIALGPGLVVNGIKGFWSRPRPRMTSAFGERFAYTRVLDLHPPGPHRSFPSGHAAMGFALLVPWFVLRRRHLGLALACLGIGLGYGALVGASRMAMGSHFLSDIFWSLGFVYLVGLLLHIALGTGTREWPVVVCWPDRSVNR